MSTRQFGKNEKKNANEKGNMSTKEEKVTINWIFSGHESSQRAPRG